MKTYKEESLQSCSWFVSSSELESMSESSVSWGWLVISKFDTDGSRNVVKFDEFNKDKDVEVGSISIFGLISSKGLSTKKN